MATVLNEGEKKEPEWWCRHHKANVLHLVPDRVHD